MKICVIGAGAMGSAIGGLLSTTEADVVLLDTWEAHVRAMNEHGLRLDTGSDQRIIPVRAATDARTVGLADLVVVLVKSYDTRVALTGAREIVGPCTRVVSLQNGLGNEDTIAELVGRERVIAGVTHAGSVLDAPGEVRFGGEGKKTYLGVLSGVNDHGIDDIVRLFSSAGLATEATDNILGIKWNKLLVNVAVSPLSAITGLPHGGMDQSAEVKRGAYEAVAEAMRVARACGVRLPVEDPEQIWLTATSGLPAAHKSSMLKDVEKGTRTEIDVINGAVVRYGTKCGVATPINDTLVACVKGLEFRNRSTSQRSD
jgi:2-dehydropantoate 2-reductase